MKIEREIVSLFEEVFSTGKYARKLFVPTPQNVNYIEKRIRSLEKAISTQNTVYYFHCQELLNYIKDVVNIFLSNPGYYLVNTIESLITAKVFIRREKLTNEEIVSIRKLLNFIREYVKINEVYLEGLSEEIKILLKILRNAYKVKHDTALIEIMYRLNTIKEEIKEFISSSKKNLMYEDILEKIYGITLREIENYIIFKTIEYEKALNKTFSESREPPLSIKQTIQALKVLAEDTLESFPREKLHVKKMPLVLTQYYGKAVYIPSERIYRKTAYGLLWINPKAVKKLSRGELIMLLAHETYFGHHYHYTSLAKQKIPILMKIPTYAKATPLVEGIAVYGEYAIGENLGYEREVVKRIFIKLIRALNDIALNKDLSTPAIVERHKEIVEKYTAFSKTRPGYWLCHIAGLKYMKELERNADTLRQLYGYITKVGLVSLNLLKGVEYAYY